MIQIIANQSINRKSTKFSHSQKFKIIFWIFFLLSLLFIILLFFIKYNKIKKEKISKDLISSYEITTLYNKNQKDYTANKLIENFPNDSPFVIGLISIDKINMIYPILSSTTDNLLEIAPCRFYGPMPNEIGNLCIAGHNYADNKIFGKLYLIDIGDEIDIYDLSGNKITYIIYNKEEVEPDNLSCLNQNTSNLREITLITCNTIKGTRHIIKAKENR